MDQAVLVFFTTSIKKRKKKKEEKKKKCLTMVFGLELTLWLTIGRR